MKAGRLMKKGIRLIQRNFVLLIKFLSDTEVFVIHCSLNIII